MKTVSALACARGVFARPHRALAIAVAVVAACLMSANLAAAADVRIKEQVECLALTIYFEARGEPVGGQLAVGHVVMNRVADSRFPDDVCEVVRQGGEKVLHRCQFSWWCDGRSDTPRQLGTWRKIKALARRIFWQYSEDPTNGAMWYHADYVAPSWRNMFARGPRIGRHIFYVDAAEGVRDQPQIARLP